MRSIITRSMSTLKIYRNNKGKTRMDTFAIDK